MIRAVLDTNVIISGITKYKGVNGRLLKAFWEGNKYSLVISNEILEEISKVIRYGKIKKIHKWNEEKIEVFLNDLKEVSLMTEPERSVKIIIDDPDDDKFISCALAGKADFIVTGDAHLLNLREYQGIKIVTPRDFQTTLETAL